MVAKVYISSSGTAGVPRLNYQEGIISAVKRTNGAAAFLRELDRSALEECVDDGFQLKIGAVEGWH